MLWKGTIQRIWNLAMMKCVAWCTATPTPTATGHATGWHGIRGEQPSDALHTIGSQESGASESKETNCCCDMLGWFAGWLTTLRQCVSALPATLSKTGLEFQEDNFVVLKNGQCITRLVLAASMIVILLSSFIYKFFKGNNFDKSLTGYLFRGSLMNAENYFDEHYFPDNRAKYTKRDYVCQEFARCYAYISLKNRLYNSDFLNDLAYLHAVPARITGKETDRIQDLRNLCPEIKETVPEMYWNFITYKYCWLSLSGSKQEYFLKRMEAIEDKEAKKMPPPPSIFKYK